MEGPSRRSLKRMVLETVLLTSLAAGTVTIAQMVEGRSLSQAALNGAYAGGGVAAIYGLGQITGYQKGRDDEYEACAPIITPH